MRWGLKITLVLNLTCVKLVSNLNINTFFSCQSWNLLLLVVFWIPRGISCHFVRPFGDFCFLCHAYGVHLAHCVKVWMTVKMIQLVSKDISIYLSIYIFFFFFYFMLFHVSLRKWWACFLSWQCTCWREFCSLCHGFPSMEFHRKSVFTEEEWLALFWLDSLKSLLGSLGEMQTLL